MRIICALSNRGPWQKRSLMNSRSRCVAVITTCFIEIQTSWAGGPRSVLTHSLSPKSSGTTVNLAKQLSEPTDRCHENDPAAACTRLSNRRNGHHKFRARRRPWLAASLCQGPSFIAPQRGVEHSIRHEARQHGARSFAPAYPSSTRTSPANPRDMVTACRASRY